MKKILLIISSLLVISTLIFIFTYNKYNYEITREQIIDLYKTNKPLIEAIRKDLISLNLKYPDLMIKYTDRIIITSSNKEVEVKDQKLIEELNTYFKLVHTNKLRGPDIYVPSFMSPNSVEFSFYYDISDYGAVGTGILYTDNKGFKDDRAEKIEDNYFYYYYTLE